MLTRSDRPYKNDIFDILESILIGSDYFSHRQDNNLLPVSALIHITSLLLLVVPHWRETSSKGLPFWLFVEVVVSLLHQASLQLLHMLLVIGLRSVCM